MRRIWAIALKEFRQTARDPFSLLMLLAIPAFMLLLYGYALNFDVRHIRVAVQDLSKSEASRELIASFVNSTYFDLSANLPAGADLARMTERRQARAILVIPERFQRELDSGRTADVQLILDGTDANTATTVLGYASSLVSEANLRRARANGSRALDHPPINFQPRVWYNPELESTQFIVPGLIGFILMLTAVLSTALSLVREKERGTLEQLRVTSLAPHQIILGKILPYLVISLTATIVILTAARLLFGVRVRGPLLDLSVVVIVYLLGALGLGLLVSSVSKSQAMAFQLGSLISMLPAIFLSGFIFPIRAMPYPLQLFTLLIPARYFLVILRGIILKGAGLGAYPTDMLFLTLTGVVVMAAAYARLKRRDL